MPLMMKKAYKVAGPFLFYGLVLLKLICSYLPVGISGLF